MEDRKIKVGDRVKLDNVLNNIWGRWANVECDKDEVYVVSKVFDEKEGQYIDMKGLLLTHKASQFRHAPDAVTIILRRPSDRKSIEKFLDEKGYTQHDPFNNMNRVASRIINVHFRGSCIGERTYNAQVRYNRGTKWAIAENKKFLIERFGHENFEVVKTKPSVNKAIEELKKYI